jgi:putative spermidine/putrescine transport system substrate-binding protein
VNQAECDKHELDNTRSLRFALNSDQRRNAADRQYGGAVMKLASTRRELLRNLAIGSAGALFLPRLTPAMAAPANIVAASFSGVWQEGLEAGPIVCYKEKNGGNVELVFGTPSDFAQKVMATRGQPAIDVVIGTDADVFQNAQLGIIEQLDPAKMPNLAGILPIFKDPYEGWAFGYDGGRDGVTFNSDKVKEPPKTWIEFTERVAKGDFGRAVMYPHLTATDGLAITWLLNRELGGSLDNPEPAIKRISEMKSNITKFYTSNAEPGTALTSGEIDIAAWTDGRTYGVQAAGYNNIQFVLPAPGSPLLTICFMKVKDGAESGWEYLNCAADPKSQAAWNKFFPGYYMTHKDVEYVPESREKQDPTSLDKSFASWVLTPWKELARVRPMWLDVWTREIGA